MHVDIVTIFPEVFPGFLTASILRRAQEVGALTVAVHNLRDYTYDRHKVVDDYPYGGGPGMVMKPEPWFRAVEDLKSGAGVGAWAVFFSPQGAVLTQERVQALACRERLLLLCGHYEGVDQRVVETLADEELSLGDYILTGGELPALVVVDAVARLLPGVLGNEASADEESFASGLLEYPQYTRPQEYAGLSVPPVLLSGHHEQIRRWRRREALRRTRQRRPDLLARSELSAEDRELLSEIEAEAES